MLACIMYDISVCTIFHVCTADLWGFFFFFLFFVFSGSRGGWVVVFFCYIHTYMYVTSLGSKIRRRIKIDIDDGLIEVFFFAFFGL